MSRVYASFDFSSTNCPVCNSVLESATYYLAKPIDVKTRMTFKDAQAMQSTTTTYTNIARHEGALCTSCGRRMYKKTRVRGLRMIVIGLGLVILLSFFPIAFGLSYYDYINSLPNDLETLIEYGVPLATIAGILSVIIGVVLAMLGGKYAWFKKHPKSITDEEASSYLFLQYVDTAKMPEGLHALSTSQYEKLKPLENNR